MKYTAAASPSNIYPGREFVSLSPKLTASTYSDGFGYQYNSPKTQPARGFALPKSNNDAPILLTRSPKNESQKPKPVKGLFSMAGSSTPSHKLLSSSAVNNKGSTPKKGEALRTVGSGTPKNSSSYRSAESMRSETGYTGKYKKLEINTAFDNVKSSYGSKAQTTKHTETDENYGGKTPSKAFSLQNVQKSLQSKNDNSSAYTIYTQESKNNDKSEKPRSSRPLSTSAVKENKANKEANLSRSSYRKEKSTNANDEAMNKKFSSTAQLRSSWQVSSNEENKSKRRPLSAKKVSKDTKEEQQRERESSQGPKPATQKASLQGFVAQINRGDIFSNIKKPVEKRDNSAKKIQKPNLNIDEKASKPIKVADLELKGSKTTTNTESKTFTVNLGKTLAQSPTASSQLMVQKKNSKGKEAVKATQEVVKTQNTGRDQPFIYYMTSLEKAHRWNGEADYFVQVYKEHFLQSFQALSFVKTVKTPDANIIAQKRVHLPRRETHKDKKTLVFDMDETLIHCNESADMPCDVVLPIIFPNGEVVEAGINVRPYAIEILKELSQYYEIIVFTASHSCYANVVLDYLDPHEEFIHHRLFRESCVVTEEGVHIKDLRVIGNRNLEDVILVDNAAYSFGFQIENGIPIIPYYDNKADQELFHLIPYLKFLSSVRDLREINKQTFKLHHYAAYDVPEAVLERIVAQN